MRGPGGWDTETFRRRIAVGGGVRHEACSPNAEEVRAYAGCLPDSMEAVHAVVLGMTPELRRLAAAHFKTFSSVDQSTAAIDIFRDWLPPGSASRETILCSDWISALAERGRANAIFADGCLPNLPPDSQDELLACIRRHLRPGGRFVTRQPCYPQELFDGIDLAGELIRCFRSGEMDAPAFALGLRLKGFLASCYDAPSGRLDNASVYAKVDAMLATGELLHEEYEIAQIALFSGTNWIFRIEAWERRLDRAGFRYRRVELKGRDWYSYYPVYCCELR